MAAAASASASLLPITAARPLAGTTLSFGGSYQQQHKKRIPTTKEKYHPYFLQAAVMCQLAAKYSMQAYKRYGVVKGTILTAWRLCRFSPLGGHGYDPPRWFGEEELPEQ